MSSAAGKKSGGEALPEFTSFYLQQATREFGEDLDKVRATEDFKGDALPMLIRALQQGTALFPPADQQRVVAARGGTAAAAAATKRPSSQDNEDVDMADAATASSSSSSSSGGSSDDEK